MRALLTWHADEERTRIVERQFNYKAASSNSVLMFVCAIVFGAAGGYLLATGIGLRYRSVSIPPEMARWIWVAMIVLAVVFLIAGIVAASRGSQPRSVIVGPTRVVVPKGELSNQVVTFDPRTITKVKVYSHNGDSRAVITFVGGKASVLSGYLGSAQVFAEFLKTLETARAGARY